VSLVTSFTVHSFFSLSILSFISVSLAGLARGEHIGLEEGDSKAGDAGVEGTGVGRGVGSFKEASSVSDRGKLRRENGFTVGHDSPSIFTRLSVDDDRL